MAKSKGSRIVIPLKCLFRKSGNPMRIANSGLLYLRGGASWRCVRIVRRGRRSGHSGRINNVSCSIRSTLLIRQRLSDWVIGGAVWIEDFCHSSGEEMEYYETLDYLASVYVAGSFEAARQNRE